MGKHLVKNGFMPDYTWWVHHGEAYRMREEVVRPRVEAFDADAEVADMLDDFHQGSSMRDVRRRRWRQLHRRSTT